MNTILQKRIKTESNKYMEEVIEMNSAVGDNLHYQDLKTCFIEAADFALQNQWISVEEALPEDKTKVFVIVKTPVGIVHRADYHINDYWYMSRYSPEEIVTHWMPIPSLGGGEE